MIRASAGVLNRKRPLWLTPLRRPPPQQPLVVAVSAQRLLSSSTTRNLKSTKKGYYYGRRQEQHLTHKKSLHHPMTAGSVVALRNKRRGPLVSSSLSSSFHHEQQQQQHPSSTYRCQHQLAAVVQTAAAAAAATMATPDLSDKHLENIKFLVHAMQSSTMMKFPPSANNPQQQQQQQQLSIGLSSIPEEEQQQEESPSSGGSSSFEIVTSEDQIVTSEEDEKLQLQPYQAQIFGDVIDDILGDNDSFTTQPQQQQQQQVQLKQQELVVEDPPVPSTEAVTAKKTMKTIASSKEMLAQKRKLEFAIEKAIRNKDHEKAFRCFEMAINQNIRLDNKQVIDLFFLVIEKDPIAAYHILQYCNNSTNILDSLFDDEEGGRKRKKTKIPVADMYRRICKSIELLSNVSTRLKRTDNFIQTLVSDLATKSIEIKRQAYPKLCMSLAEQRNGSIGVYAYGIYQFMVDNEFDLSPKYLKRLLMLSRYNRQDDIPYENVLLKLVEMNESPHPFHAIQAVHNMFPYTDERKMTIALKSLMTLFQRHLHFLSSDDKKEEEKTDDDDEDERIVWTQYIMDMATLETISSSAARLGSADMMMYVWEIMDLCGYSPNETIYENTVIAFAAAGSSSSYDDANANHDDEQHNNNRMLMHQAFTILAEMKSEGFDVSRPLIRSFSRAIRSYKPDVAGALQMLTNHDVTLLSVESLNVILSAFAERGDVLDVLQVLEIMRRSGVKPNADSYSFALEVLGKNMARHKGGHFVWQLRSIDTADSILTKMEEHETDLTADVIRNYVELLCIVGEVSTANAIVNDCHARNRNDLVNNKTLYRLATANADEGDIDTARRQASMTTEAIPILYRKIKSKEVWHLRKNNNSNHNTETNERNTTPRADP